MTYVAGAGEDLLIYGAIFADNSGGATANVEVTLTAGVFSETYRVTVAAGEQGAMPIGMVRLSPAAGAVTINVSGDQSVGTGMPYVVNMTAIRTTV
jgi:hypothetical protein